MAIINQPSLGRLKFRGSTDRWDSLFSTLKPLPAAFLISTLVSDLLLWKTDRAFWSDASNALLAAATGTSAYAAAHMLIRYVLRDSRRPSAVCCIQVIGYLSALVLSLSNLVYRLDPDRGDAVAPAGIALTLIAACLLILTGRLGHDTGARPAHDDQDDAYQFWDELIEPSGPVGAEAGTAFADNKPQPESAQFRLRVLESKAQGEAQSSMAKAVSGPPIE